MKKALFTLIVTVAGLAFVFASCTQDAPEQVPDKTEAYLLYEKLNSLPTASILNATTTSTRSDNEEGIIYVFTDADLAYLSSLSQSEFEDLVNRLFLNLAQMV